MNNTNLAVKTQLTRRVRVQGLIAGLAIAVANQVQERHKHAARCKESPSECHLCLDNARYMRELPPGDISKVLENVQAPSLKVPLKVVAFENARNQWSGKGGRHERNFHASASLFAYHKDHHPEQYRKGR